MRKFYFLLFVVFFTTVVYGADFQNKDTVRTVSQSTQDGANLAVSQLFESDKKVSDAKKKAYKNILDEIIHDHKYLNIYLDTRFDGQTTFDKHFHQNDMGFQAQSFKFWFMGDITPKIHYVLKQRLNKSMQPTTRDNISYSTDLMFFTFDIGDKWSITFGKQSIQFGTYEIWYNVADVYVPTIACNDLDAYKTGINFAYKWKKQVFDFQAVDADMPQFSSEEYKTKGLSYSLMWEGHLLNDKLQTRWAYSWLQNKKTTFFRWITMGTQVNLNKLAIDLDCYSGDRMIDYGSMVNNDKLGYKRVQDEDISLNFKYNFGVIRPIIKATWDNRFDKEMHSDVYQTQMLQGIIEVYPFQKHASTKDLRFHAEYAFMNTHFRGSYKGLDNQVTHLFMVGMRWMFKVK